MQGSNETAENEFSSAVQDERKTSNEVGEKNTTVSTFPTVHHYIHETAVQTRETILPPKKIHDDMLFRRVG
jgi:hypothetical protein